MRMASNNFPRLRAKATRGRPVIPHALAALAIACAIIGGCSLEKRASGQAAGAESVVRSLNARLAIADEILGYALA
jgi:hypothetical protein